MNAETKAARFIEERAARAALAAFNGDDEAMADALMAAPEATLSAITRAIIPIIAAAERERCAKIGWEACRRQVYALAEDTQDKYGEIAQADQEGKHGAYSRGRCAEAKSIARALGALGSENCDVLSVAIRARPSMEADDGR